MLILFTATLFVSSALLFLLEPMFAKMVLPLLGGTPAVWNTCVVFFQAALLAGYAYSHVVTTRLPIRTQAALQTGLLLLAMALLPIGLNPGWTPPGDRSPIPWLMKVLVVSVGLPFFAVSTTTPLLQRWFSATRHTSARDPYFLYAAGNAGSIVALLSYPVLVEPALRLREQSVGWALGYAALFALTIACAAVAWRGPATNPEAARTKHPPGNDAAPSVTPALPTELSNGQRLRWIALAAAPSSLMLAVTTYVSTDIASVPLLWVIPLVLYLLSFIIAFGLAAPRVFAAASRALPLFVLPLVLIVFTQATQPALLIIPLHLAGFFILALVCHLELARSRPAPMHLTEFYLWMSVGGLVGGLFNTLLAPVLFARVAEYPLVLAIACMLGPRRAAGSEIGAVWRSGVVRVLIVAALSAVLALFVRRMALNGVTMFVVLCVPLFVAFSLSRRPVYFGAAVGAIAFGGMLHNGGQGTILHRERTFFGVYRVVTDRDGAYHSLYHGTTLHGKQSLDPSRSSEPLTYYHREGPVGQLLQAFSAQKPGGHVAVVGMGTGSLVAYATARQQWTFYEIDPAVVRISEDQQYFTFLSRAATHPAIVLGDARLSLRNASPHGYDLIILDAFSSDAIPVHLLTAQALSVYRNALAEDGLIAFHISNRHLDLQPVLSSLAEAGHLVTLIRSDIITEESMSRGNASSDWLVMAASPKAFLNLGSDPRWVPPRKGATSALWTDDFSNIWTVFKGR